MVAKKITAESQRSFHIDLSGMTNEKGDSGIRGEADPRVRRCRLSKSARGCPQCPQTAQWPLGTLLGEGRERDCPTCTRSLDGTLDANRVLIFQFAKKAALDKAWADDIKPCEMRDDVSYLPRTPAVRLAAYEGNCFRYRELGSTLFDRIDGKTDGTRWYYDELARKRRDHECREVGAPRLSTLQAKRIQSPRCPNGCHVLV